VANIVFPGSSISSDRFRHTTIVNSKAGEILETNRCLKIRERVKVLSNLDTCEKRIYQDSKTSDPAVNKQS